MMAGITYDLRAGHIMDNKGAAPGGATCSNERPALSWGFKPQRYNPLSAPLWIPAPYPWYGAGLSIAGVTVAVDGGERQAPDIGVASRYRRRSRIGVRDMLS